MDDEMLKIGDSNGRRVPSLEHNQLCATRHIVFTGSMIVCLIATVKFLLHLYAAHNYGYFVDELYFMACSDHLAWGYVDMPSLIAVMMKLTRFLFGDSLQSIRFFAAAAGAANILLAGHITRELGGGRFAQGLTALAVLMASANLSMDHYMSMNAFEPLFWMGCAFFVIRIIKTGNQKLWLWVGLITGIGMNNKYSMAFFCLGVATGLLFTRQRRVFLQPWIWLGAALALALFLPNLIWNIKHHFPFLELMANIRRSGFNMAFSKLTFLQIQVVFLSPITLPIWLTGLYWFLFNKDGRDYRALGFAYLIVLFIMFSPNGKPYYLLPIYPMFMAAGAVLLEKWFSHSRREWAKPSYAILLLLFGVSGIPFALPVLSPETYIRYSIAMHFSPPPIERAHLGPLPHFFADQFGWEEMTQVVAKSYANLPAEDRKTTAILASNYGEAGAIDFFGKKYGLPNAISGNQNYSLWGPNGYTGASVLTMGFSREKLESYFNSVEAVGSVYHPYSAPREHFTVYHCHGPKQPMSELWTALKYWD